MFIRINTVCKIQQQLPSYHLIMHLIIVFITDNIGNIIRVQTKVMVVFIIDNIGNIMNAPANKCYITDNIGKMFFYSKGNACTNQKQSKSGPTHIL